MVKDKFLMASELNDLFEENLLKFVYSMCY
jgi:hypothetical protein